MVTLKPFKFNWKALNEALNAIVDAINRNSPLEGENVHLDEKGTKGVSINAVTGGSSGAKSQSGGGGGGGEGGQWITVNVLDDNCNQSTIQVWGIPPQQ